MFFPGSRYEKLATYTVTLPGGRQITAVRLPVASRAPVIGAYPRDDAQRLDLIAAQFLGDPTSTWRLCDANRAVSPDALAVRATVLIPVKST